MTFRKLIILSVALNALVALGVGLVSGTVVRSGVDDSERQVCHRLNVHRVADDNNAYRAWRVNTRFADLIIHPAPGSPKQSLAQQAAAAGFLALLQAQLGDETWTPPTADCRHPGEGQDPVRFAVREPSKADLRLGPHG